MLLSLSGENLPGYLRDYGTTSAQLARARVMSHQREDLRPSLACTTARLYHGQQHTNVHSHFETPVPPWPASLSHPPTLTPYTLASAACVLGGVTCPVFNQQRTLMNSKLFFFFFPIATYSLASASRLDVVIYPPLSLIVLPNVWHRQVPVAAAGLAPCLGDVALVRVVTRECGDRAATVLEKHLREQSVASWAADGVEGWGVAGAAGVGGAAGGTEGGGGGSAAAAAAAEVLGKADALLEELAVLTQHTESYDRFVKFLVMEVCCCVAHGMYRGTAVVPRLRLMIPTGFSDVG